MTYPDVVTFYRGSSTAADGAHGAQSDDGTWTPDANAPNAGAPAVIGTTSCDVQDRRARKQLGADGTPQVLPNVVLYLEDESLTRFLQSGDYCTVTFVDGSTRDADVLATAVLDGSVDLVWSGATVPAA